jgi:hypothetical protein
MARKTGKGFYLAWISGGTTVISGDYRSFEDGLEQESADMSAGGDELRVYAKTLKSLKPSGEFVFSDGSAGSAVWTKLQPGSEGTLVWGWEGNGAGKPKWGVPCFVEKSNTSTKYDGETTIQVGWANTGGDWAFNGTTNTF